MNLLKILLLTAGLLQSDCPDINNGVLQATCIDIGNGTPTPPMTGKPILSVFFGESNSGGIAPNTSALARELRNRTLPILNNTTHVLEPLHIGFNNLIGHSGLEYAMYTSHGMELELANRNNYLVFGNRPLYLVKAGQGGSQSFNWDGSTYFRDTMYSRVNSARNLIFAETGQYPELVFMLSVGINERSSTPAATYKTNIQNIISATRTYFSEPTATFGLMQFQFVGTMTDYNTKLAEIAAADTNTFVFSTDSCGNIGDGIHLNYSGFKKATTRFITGVQSKL